MPTIRQFTATDADYAAITQIEAAVWPDTYPTESRFREDDEKRPSNRYFQRLIIEEDGQPVGFAGYMETWWSAEPDEYNIYINIHPDWQRRGMGSAIYDHIVDTLHRERKVAVLKGGGREDKISGIRFLEKYGFAQISRYPRSLLDVQTFDHEPFAKYPQRMKDAAIKIKTFTELKASDPDWATKLWELHWVVVKDEPGPTEPIKMPLDEFLKQNTEGNEFLGDAYFVATDGDRYVGLSQLWCNAGNPKFLWQGWTGVDRPYRQKGIATALKLHTIAFAKQYGADVIESDNFEGNPMYDINMRLGFKPAPAYLGFKKVVKDA